jgi:hypothetical protein
MAIIKDPAGNEYIVGPHTECLSRVFELEGGEWVKIGVKIEFPEQPKDGVRLFVAAIERSPGAKEDDVKRVVREQLDDFDRKIRTMVQPAEPFPLSPWGSA